MQPALSSACLTLAARTPRLSAIDGRELLRGRGAVCAATRSSILTGRYVQRLGYQHNNPPKAVRRILYCALLLADQAMKHPPPSDRLPVCVALC